MVTDNRNVPAVRTGGIDHRGTALHDLEGTRFHARRDEEADAPTDQAERLAGRDQTQSRRN